MRSNSQRSRHALLGRARLGYVGSRAWASGLALTSLLLAGACVTAPDLVPVTPRSEGVALTRAGNVELSTTGAAPPRDLPAGLTSIEIVVRNHRSEGIRVEPDDIEWAAPSG